MTEKNVPMKQHGSDEKVVWGFILITSESER